MRSIFAGIDLHSNNAVCGLVDETGQRLKRQKLPNQLHPIVNFLNPYKGELKEVGVEATFNWYWLVDGLQAEGFPVVLANPAAMQQYEGVKHTDDESDAFFVAELLRLGILPTGHICERKLRPFRDMLRRRLLLVRQRTSQLLSLKSLYARNTGQTLSQGEVKALELEEVPQLFSHPADQLIAGEQLKVMEQLHQGIRQIERAVEAVADKLPCYAGLQGLPGIGRILGLTITMETAGVERFPSP
ncbi:MAG: transposase [Verrucomicrobiia bacterium]